MLSKVQKKSGSESFFNFRQYSVDVEEISGQHLTLMILEKFGATADSLASGKIT